MGVAPARGGPGIKNRNISSTAGIATSKIDDFSYSIDFSTYGASKGLANLQSDGTAYDSTALSLNIMHIGGGHKLAAVAIVAETLPPAMTATGLNIAGDQTADDGFEIFGGVLGTSGRPAIIGDDPAFYFKLKHTCGDVSGTDDLQVGFRRAETVNAAFDNYLDAATLGCNTAADPMAIKIATILNNAATTETDTTDTLADSTTTTWQINVSGGGAVTYLINGAAPTATAAFTFDDGDPVIPFVRFLQDTALVDTWNLIQWEVGWL